MMEISDLLSLSVDQHASDLHLLPHSSPIMRIDGKLVNYHDIPPLSAEETKRLIFSLLSAEQQHLFEKNLISDLAVSIEKIGNFRLSILHQLNGVSAVFRIIPEKVPTFEELGLPAILESLLIMPHGLILVTGPTGSGKTTTLAGMIDYINTYRACNIITIEDPIEFIHQSKRSIFNQIQIGRDTPDFATGLRSSLRHDPDVLLIGELRDLETMSLALTAAETGHLVLATLHASSAPLSISRFVDVFPSEEKNRVRNLLSETLQAVICQTLVKRLSEGRVAAFEIMLASTPIRHYIRQDMIANMESTIQTSGDKGMCTLERYLQELVEKRVIHAKEAATLLSQRQLFKEINNKK